MPLAGEAGLYYAAGAPFISYGHVNVGPAAGAALLPQQQMMPPPPPQMNLAAQPPVAYVPMHFAPGAGAPALAAAGRPPLVGGVPTAFMVGGPNPQLAAPPAAHVMQPHQVAATTLAHQQALAQAALQQQQMQLQLLAQQQQQQQLAQQQQLLREHAQRQLLAAQQQQAMLQYAAAAPVVARPVGEEEIRAATSSQGAAISRQPSAGSGGAPAVAYVQLPRPQSYGGLSQKSESSQRSAPSQPAPPRSRQLSPLHEPAHWPPAEDEAVSAAAPAATPLAPHARHRHQALASSRMFSDELGGDVLTGGGDDDVFSAGDEVEQAVSHLLSDGPDLDDEVDGGVFGFGDDGDDDDYGGVVARRPAKGGRAPFFGASPVLQALVAGGRRGGLARPFMDRTGICLSIEPQVLVRAERGRRLPAPCSAPPGLLAAPPQTK